MLKEFEFQSFGLKENFPYASLEHDVHRALLSIINKREDNSILNDAGKKQPQNKQLNTFRPQLLHVKIKHKIQISVNNNINFLFFFFNLDYK